MPTPAQIKAEIDTDPKALGYATLRTQSNGPEAIANRMNELGASAETLFKAYTPVEDFTAAVVASEYTALVAANKTLWNDLVTKGGTRGVKTGDANMRATLSGIFAAGTTSRANLVALASRSASRAEALWGEGTRVDATQVARALESP